MTLPPIIGESPAMKRAIALMERFAPTNLPVFLVGATGTGKDFFARHIHERSRRVGELVDVNCGALPHEMIESLLFGHRRGAFTGAIDSVVGHVERAHQGTLFLDEVMHLSVAGQVKLLRVLESEEVQPLGESRKRRIDLRVVAAAQDDANARLSDGRFRRDLFQRLAGVVIGLPALCERPSDLMPLATYFASQQHQRLEAGANKVLREYPWPGNVRELRLTIQRAGCLVENGSLPGTALAEAIEMGAPSQPVSQRGRELLECLSANGWNVPAAAASSGIRRSTFYEQLRREGVSIRDRRVSRPNTNPNGR